MRRVIKEAEERLNKLKIFKTQISKINILNLILF